MAKTMCQEFKYDPEKCSFKSWLRHLAQQKRIADSFHGGLRVSHRRTKRRRIRAACGRQRSSVWPIPPF